MRKPLLFVVAALVAGTVLAATVYRDDIAQAAAKPGPVFVINTAADAVPVQDQNSPAQEPAYFQGSAGSIANPVVPAVPAGKRFIASYINLFNVGAEPESCTVSVGPPGGTFSSVASIALQPSAGSAIANEELFIPLEAGQALAVVSCTGALSTFVSIGGYYVPAG